MKSRISLFDTTIFRKAVTRFLPLWLIYFAGGLLVMNSVMNSVMGDHHSFYAASHMGNSIGPLAIVNFIYAALCAQMLFGDLFNPRLCNAIHAMPVRRETLFITHFVAGLAFSLIPNLVGILLLMPGLGEYWYLGFMWLLGMELHFLFFFGLAVLCMFLTGNRFAMVAVYGILNFLSMILCWFVDTIYQPLMYGSLIDIESFVRFCPVVQMVMDAEDFILMSTSPNLFSSTIRLEFEGFGDAWGYLAVTAVLGVAFAVLALVLYRRRKLESAGDFMAFPPFAPVFSVVYTLCIGAIFDMFGSIWGGHGAFLLVGLAVGFFTGQMLLRRTVKVFQGKSFLKLAILVVVLVATMVATYFDPLGLTRWVPETDEVEYAVVEDHNAISEHSRDYAELRHPESIDLVRDIHATLVREGRTEIDYEAYTYVSIRYKLKSGRTVDLRYSIDKNHAAYDKVLEVVNTPERILGASSLEQLLEKAWRIMGDKGKLDRSCYEGLLTALWQDCQEGNLYQRSEHHKGENPVFSFSISMKNDKYYHITIWECAEHTIKWLKEEKGIWMN